MINKKRVLIDLGFCLKILIENEFGNCMSM